MLSNFSKEYRKSTSLILAGLLGVVGLFSIAAPGNNQSAAAAGGTLNRPTIGTVSAISTTSIQINFTDSDTNFSSTYDKIQANIYSSASGGSALSGLGGTSTSDLNAGSLTVTGLSSGTTYYVTIFANAGTSHSGWNDSAETSPRVSVSTPASTSSTTVTGSVTTIQKCVYGLSGISSSVTLSAGATYNPDITSGSATLTGSAGTLTASAFPDANNPFNAACSFYGASSQNPTVKASISSTSWTTNCSSSCASGATTFTWNVASSYTSTGSPINLSIAQNTGLSGSRATDCSNKNGGANAWSLVGSPQIVSTTSVTIMSATNTQPLQCDATIGVSTVIPYLNYAPNGQATYTVTGPTIYYTLVVG